MSEKDLLQAITDGTAAGIDRLETADAYMNYDFYGYCAKDQPRCLETLKRCKETSKLLPRKN